jgi:hypothetical protein
MYQQKAFDPLIHFLLRAYGGLFENAVTISESRIAKSLQSEEKTVHMQLKELHKRKLLHYNPPADGATLCLTTERLEERQIFTDSSKYRALQERQEKKLIAMLNYAENRSACRQHLLLEYLGAATSTPCGRCDYCLHLHASGVEATSTFLQHLHRLLKSAPLSMTDILTQSGVHPSKAWQEWIREQADSGLLIEAPSGLWSLK